MDPITAQELLAAAGAGGDPVYVEDVFQTHLYIGSGSAKTITNGIDLSGEGGLVITKRRNSSSGNGPWFNDTERGITRYNSSSSTSAETNNGGGISATSSTGYSLGSFSGWNASGGTYVSYTLRKSEGFFDISTWTGTGVGNRTVSHALKSTPGAIFIKNTSSDSDWHVYHQNANGDLCLNKADAEKYQVSAVRNVPSAPFGSIEVNRRNGYLLVADTASSGGTAQYVYYSQDGGQNWTSRQLFTGVGADCHKIHWAYDYFYFSGHDNGGSGQYHLKYSQDGHNWYNAISTSTNTHFDYVQYARNIGSGTYVVSAQNHSYYWTSTNGTSWTQRNYPSGVTNMHIQCSEDACVAVKRGSTNVYYYSTDAINWTQANSPFGTATGYHSLHGSNGDKDGKGAFVGIAKYNAGPFHTFNGVNWFGSGSFTNGQRQWGAKVHYSNGHYYHHDGGGNLRQSRLGYGTNASTIITQSSGYPDFYADEDHYGLRGATSNTTLALYPTPKSTTNVGSTSFSVGLLENKKDDTYVAYIFGSDEQSYGTNNDQAIIKCGSFATGSGNPEVTIGFEPQYVILKKLNGSAENWGIFDTERNMNEFNDLDLNFNDSTPEAAFNFVQPRPRGMGLISAGSNNTYAYIAIRRGHKPAEVGTDSFAVTSTTAYSTTNAGFSPDFALQHQYSADANRIVAAARLMSTFALVPQDQSQIQNILQADSWQYHHSYYLDSVGSNVAVTRMAFRRSPGFCDCAVLTAPSTNTWTIDHNLETDPQWTIVKNMDQSQPWYIFYKVGSDNKVLQWDNHNSDWIDTSNYATGAVTTSATQITLPMAPLSAGNRYMIWYFATQPGVCKVGKYTGTGSQQTIDCGFTTGARFVMITEVGSGQDYWRLWTSARGINASSTEPFAYIDHNAADVTNKDYIDPDNSGFKVNGGSDPRVNGNGDTYIFLAIA